jgi:hypothetical protein
MSFLCALQKMHAAHVTTITDPLDSRLQDHLTRQEAAGMFVALDTFISPQANSSQPTCTRADATYICVDREESFSLVHN